MTIYGFLWRYFGWALSIGMIAGSLTLKGQEESTDFTQMLGWVMLGLWGFDTLRIIARKIDEQRGFAPPFVDGAARPAPRDWKIQRGPAPKIATEPEVKPAPDLRGKEAPTQIDSLIRGGR